VLAAAGLAAVCAAAGVLGGAVWQRSAPTYAVASGPAPAADVAGSTLLDVVFRDDTDAGRIREALRAVRGEVVSGPTELGRYRVRIPAGEDALAAARALGPGGADVAVFAEPVPR
jgi:hypothetical protein